MTHREGDPVEPPCPECGGRCVYNGNYFCTKCKWAFPHPNPPHANSAQLQKWGLDAYVSLMAYRKETPRPNALKLEAWRY